MNRSTVSQSGFDLQTVRVGTLNGPKLEAVRSALAAFSPELEVVGHEVESGIPDQPVGLKEIVIGARNRARAAYEKGPCDLAVGIEDGLVPLPEIGSEVMNIGAAVLTDGQRESVGLSSGFAYPPDCLPPALKDREPIGGVFDRYWKERVGEESSDPSALSVGNIGRLSLGELTRSEYGRHAVVCAWIRFLHPEMYAMASHPKGEEALSQGLQDEYEEENRG